MRWVLIGAVGGPVLLVALAYAMAFPWTALALVVGAGAMFGLVTWVVVDTQLETAKALTRARQDEQARIDALRQAAGARSDDGTVAPEGPPMRVQRVSDAFDWQRLRALGQMGRR